MARQTKKTSKPETAKPQQSKSIKNKSKPSSKITSTFIQNNTSKSSHKKRKAAKEIDPSFYIGYVEEGETVEQIMKKFETLERIQNEKVSNNETETDQNQTKNANKNFDKSSQLTKQEKQSNCVSLNSNLSSAELQTLFKLTSTFTPESLAKEQHKEAEQTCLQELALRRHFSSDMRRQRRLLESTASNPTSSTSSSSRPTYNLTRLDSYMDYIFGSATHSAKNTYSFIEHYIQNCTSDLNKHNSRLLLIEKQQFSNNISDDYLLADQASDCDHLNEFEEFEENENDEEYYFHDYENQDECEDDEILLVDQSESENESEESIGFFSEHDSGSECGERLSSYGSSADEFESKPKPLKSKFKSKSKPLKRKSIHIHKSKNKSKSKPKLSIKKKCRFQNITSSAFRPTIDQKIIDAPLLEPKLIKIPTPLPYSQAQPIKPFRKFSAENKVDSFDTKYILRTSNILNVDLNEFIGGGSVQGILMNPPWLVEEAQLQIDEGFVGRREKRGWFLPEHLKEINFSSRLCPDSILFMQIEKEFTGEIVRIMQEHQNFQYVETFVYVPKRVFDNRFICSSSPVFGRSKAVMLMFRRKQEETQQFIKKEILRSGEMDVDKNIDQSCIDASSRRLELRHQRTCDVCIDFIRHDAETKQELLPEEYVYNMIETLLPTASLPEKDNESESGAKNQKPQLLELQGRPQDKCRRKGQAKIVETV